MANKKTTERFDRILIAVRSILRERGDINFTMKDVSVRAGVAPATVFNLLGNKDGLFYALLSQLLDDLFIGVRQYKATDPLQHCIEATDYVVELFLSDPIVFRELFLVFLGTRDELHRPWFMHRSLSFWRHSVSNAVGQGLVPVVELEDDALPRTLMLMFIGSVDLWVHGDLNDQGFRAQALYGSALVVLGAASGDAGGLRKRLAEIRQTLPRHHTFLRHLVPAGTKSRRPERVAVRHNDPNAAARQS
ncbi:TetR/AcrR family transcriptional regulator [Novosphingobium sp.]|uniref:TetR/AcrR family transcriptional regulator n=1 Tax=Novosphingobium sp. TaxID=1874826 RepID=UPI0038BB88A1